MSQIEIGWGLEVILWFQAWRGSLVEGIGQVFHFMGSTEFYLIVLPLVYWCIDAATGRRVGLLIVPAMWLCSMLKDWWRRPRPFMISEAVQPVVPETSYGLPSGHAQGATALGGAVAVEARRWWVTAVVVLYVVLMGISRMALGVHFPQDVIAGTLISLVLVGSYAWLEPPISRWVKDQGLWMQIGLVVGIAALALVLHPLLVDVSAPEWLDITLPRDELLSEPLMLITIFLALAIGFALEVRFVGFSAGGDWWRRVLRFVVGMLGVLAIRYGLDAAFYLLWGTNIPLVLSLVEVGLIGFWASFAAPWVFIKTGLANRISSVVADAE